MFLMSPLLKVRLKTSLVVGILLFPLAELHSTAKPWQGIVPLHSSSSESYALLGNSTRGFKYTATLELPNEIAEFLFAKGGSRGTTLATSWRSARDTVVSICGVPQKVTYDSGGTFVKCKDATQITVSHYSDLDRGVHYTAENQTEAETIISVDYLGASADRNLSCSATRQAESTPIFEQYGIISRELENAILDNYAIQLLTDPDLTGKVILRRGQYSSKVAAKKLLRIKNYLFKQRRVPANRVSAFELQRGRDFTVELYLSSKAKRRSGED